MPVKHCFVPTCENTSENNKNKIFIMLPRKPDIRRKWFTAVNRKYVSKTDLYACEDHFDLESDMKNWMEYKLLAKRIFMKETAIPRFFINLSIPEEHKFSSQISISSRKRKKKLIERFAEQGKELAKRKNNFNTETPDLKLLRNSSGNAELSNEDCFIVPQSILKTNVNKTLPSSSKTEVFKPFSVPETFSSCIDNVISAVNPFESLSGSFMSIQMEEILSSAENCYFVVTEPPRSTDKQCQTNIRVKYRSVGINTRTRTVATKTSIQ